MARSRQATAACLLGALVLLALMSASAPGARAQASGGSFGSAPQPTVTVNGVAYLDASLFLSAYGLKASWIVPGRRMAFRGAGRVIELEADRRDAEVDGLRVFLGEPVAARPKSLLVSATDARLMLLPLIRPGAVRPPAPALRTIVIDPGHGGNDTGTRNLRFRYDEKRFTLDVSLRLEKLLKARGYRVLLTRRDDRYVELEDRADFANRAGADLFISVHFNAVEKAPAVSGTETFILTRPGQRSTSSLKRDSSDRMSLPGNRHDAWNAVLGLAMHRALVGELATVDRGLKFARFKVLTLVECPAVLLEAGYLSNDAEAVKIASPAYRARIAEAVADAVADYAAKSGAGGRKR